MLRPPAHCIVAAAGVGFAVTGDAATDTASIVVTTTAADAAAAAVVC